MHHISQSNKEVANNHIDHRTSTNVTSETGCGGRDAKGAGWRQRFHTMYLFWLSSVEAKSECQNSCRGP